MQSVDLNWGAVIVAAIVSFVIGGAWYAPLVLGKRWQRLVGLTDERMREPPGPMVALAISAVLTVVTTIVLAVIVDWAEAGELIEGASVGGIIALGLFAASGLNEVTFAKRPLELFLIVQGNYLVALVVAGAILGAWQ